MSKQHSLYYSLLQPGDTVSCIWLGNTPLGTIHFFKTRQGRVFTALVKFYIVLTLLRVTGNDWLRYLHYFSLLQWTLCQIRQLQSHESCLFVTESHDRLHINSLSVMLRVFHSVQDIVGRLLARDLQEKNLNRPLHDTGCLLSLHTQIHWQCQSFVFVMICTQLCS